MFSQARNRSSFPVPKAAFVCCILAALAGASPGGAVVQEAKLVASDAATNDYFAWSVSASGTTALVGARLEDPGGVQDAGAVYVFVRSGSVWNEEAKLGASDAALGDAFGWSVAIDGDTAVVGAVGDDDAGSFSGSAYVFTRSGTSWSEQAKLTASDAASGDNFGWSVSVAGDTVAVGAIGHAEGGSPSGMVYVFARTGTAWSQEAKLVPSDLNPADEYGYSVSTFGDLVLAGSRCNESPVFDAGAAYVFARSGTTWSEEAKLVAGDADVSDWFGTSVSLSGGTALIGSPRDDDTPSECGSAYVFVRNGTSWSQEDKLGASDAASGDNFGQSVCVAGGTAVVGAWLDDDLASGAGAVYVYTRSGTSWNESVKLTASDGALFDNFGHTVSIAGERTVVGAPLDNHAGGSNAGSVYAFRHPPGTASFCDDADGSLASCPCANPGHPDAGCEISQGTGGVQLNVVVQETSPANRVTVSGSGFPAASAPAAIVIRAASLDPAAPVVFGDGLRCVGVPLVRLGASFAAGGTSVHTFGHGVMAGSGTFYYQLWFRNTPIMYCDPAAAFNLSNGRTLVW